VRLVHGKGRGVRRAEVRRLLEADPRVADAFDAPPERGGFGATVVVLKG
jgi:dsDNA-specific endonuclease/ATPase MutS2